MPSRFHTDTHILSRAIASAQNQSSPIMIDFVAIFIIFCLWSDYNVSQKSAKKLRCGTLHS